MVVAHQDRLAKQPEHAQRGPLALSLAAPFHSQRNRLGFANISEFRVLGEIRMNMVEACVFAVFEAILNEILDQHNKFEMWGEKIEHGSTSDILLFKYLET